MSTKKVKAVKMWEVRWPDDCNSDLCKDEMRAQHVMDEAEENGTGVVIQPVYVLPATPETYEAMVEQMARGMDGLAFHEYKDGECLPRGEEMSTAAEVNKVQVWRQRSALSNARRALAAIGITQPKKTK
jgi:hypothetical protein